MSIEMYDRAKVVRRNNTNYYLVKHGSKNTFDVGRRTSDDFRPEYKSRQSRMSDWRVVAKGEGKMADTKWNCPTSYVYGRIMFGNKRNIALYLDKQKPKEFEEFDEVQQMEIAVILDKYEEPRYSEFVINLEDIKEDQKIKKELEYCGKNYTLGLWYTTFDGRDYWDLDNL